MIRGYENMDRNKIKYFGGTALERKIFLDQIQEGYPEQKPVCFNYMKAREDTCLLCDIIRELENENNI